MSALLNALSSPGLEEVQRNKVIDCKTVLLVKKNIHAVNIERASMTKNNLCLFLKYDKLDTQKRIQKYINIIFRLIALRTQ